MGYEVELFTHELPFLILKSHYTRKEGKSKSEVREKSKERQAMYTISSGE